MRAARAPLLARLAPAPRARGDDIEGWITLMLGANPLGLWALHLLYCEHLADGALRQAGGEAFVVLPFESFVERVALDLHDG